MWVAWDKLLNNKEKGGLGLGSLQAQNVALLSKWWWCFKKEEGTLWKKVIVAIHGESGNLGRGSRGSGKGGTWDKMARISKATENVNIHLNSLFSKAIGTGNNTNFWSDIWCYWEPLEKRYPRLAAIDADRRCTVAERVKKRIGSSSLDVGVDL